MQVIGVRRRLSTLGGHWPLLLRRAHTGAWVLLPVLLITGALMYFPRTHVALIPYLPALAWIHNVTGLAFLALLAAPLLASLPARRVAWGDWVVTLGVGAGCCITGVILWRVGWFPAVWRSNAFALHGAAAAVLGGWALMHTAGHLARAARHTRVRPDGRPAASKSAPSLAPAPRRIEVGRRDFLKTVGSGTLLAVAGSMWLAPVARVIEHAGENTSEDAAQGWEIYSVTEKMPDIAPAAYRLKVDGLVGRPRTFTLAELQALPDIREVRNFQCVTGWVVTGVRWHGVGFDTLLNACGGANGGYLTFYSADGVYTDSLTFAQATREGPLLVYGMNDSPVSRKHGGPVRLIVPAMDGYKSVKWVDRIQVTDHRLVGYWEQRGYPINAYLPGDSRNIPGNTQT